MLSLRQLEIFPAIADQGSTTAAAERMARSQSAVSNALVELETGWIRPYSIASGAV